LCFTTSLELFFSIINVACKKTGFRDDRVGRGGDQYHGVQSIWLFIYMYIFIVYDAFFFNLIGIVHNMLVSVDQKALNMCKEIIVNYIYTFVFNRGLLLEYIIIIIIIIIILLSNIFDYYNIIHSYALLQYYACVLQTYGLGTERLKRSPQMR